jgi:hypothetical protein
MMGRQFLAGDTSGEQHIVGDAFALRERLQLLPVRSAPDDHQGRAGHPPADLAERADQHVLALARYQPGQAQHHRPVPQLIAGAQLRTRHRIGGEALDVDSG